MSTKRLLFMEDLYDFYLNKYKKSTHFSSEKNGEPLVVQVHGKVNFDNSNKDKDGLLPVHLQACHTDLNANGSNIDKKVMESALPSFSNRPILAYIHKVVTDENPEGQWEFYTHNMHEDENGELVYDEYPIGIIPESCNAQLVYDKEKNNRMMISILSQIVEFRNGESGLHVLHINRLTGILIDFLLQKTDRYPSARQQQNLIITASALHDIGKIGIDEKILNKPGKLTKEEFEIMKTHTTIGADIIRQMFTKSEKPLLRSAWEICRWHHERYDGKGYPDGLIGEQIPIAAQVVSVADVYDALVSKRVYKDAYSHEQAMKMILNGECGAFNPLLMEVLVEIQDKIKEEIRYEA